MSSPVVALASWEFRGAVRSRWVVGTAVAFSALALLVTLLGMRSIRELGLSGAGPASITLLNLAILLPSLMGMLLGSAHFASAREQGTLAMIAAQPVSRRDIAVGTFAGLTGALWSTIGVGFALAILVMSGVADAAEAGPLLALFGAALAVAAVSVAIGTALAALASGRTQALALAMVTWIVFAFGLDLLVSALAPSLHLGAGGLLIAILANPLESARVLALLVADPEATALGPLGAYLLSRVGGVGAALVLTGSLVAWTAGSLWAARWALRRNDL
jgi:Cu-processing system permease protein